MKSTYKNYIKFLGILFAGSVSPLRLKYDYRKGLPELLQQPMFATGPLQTLSQFMQSRGLWVTGAVNIQADATDREAVVKFRKFLGFSRTQLKQMLLQQLCFLLIINFEPSMLISYGVSCIFFGFFEIMAQSNPIVLGITLSVLFILMFGAVVAIGMALSPPIGAAGPPPSYAPKVKAALYQLYKDEDHQMRLLALRGILFLVFAHIRFHTSSMLPDIAVMMYMIIWHVYATISSTRKGTACEGLFKSNLLLLDMVLWAITFIFIMMTSYSIIGYLGTFILRLILAAVYLVALALVIVLSGEESGLTGAQIGDPNGEIKSIPELIIELIKMHLLSSCLTFRLYPKTSEYYLT